MDIQGGNMAYKKISPKPIDEIPKVVQTHEPLEDLLENPSDRGPKTNCVKEIDEVVCQKKQ